jgi:hypothetical protein
VWDDLFAPGLIVEGALRHRERRDAAEEDIGVFVVGAGSARSSPVVTCVVIAYLVRC